MITAIDTQQHHQTISLDIQTKAIPKDIGDIYVRKTSQIDGAGSKITDCQIDHLADKVKKNNNFDQSILTMWDFLTKAGYLILSTSMFSYVGQVKFAEMLNKNIYIMNCFTTQGLITSMLSFVNRGFINRKHMKKAETYKVEICV